MKLRNITPGFLLLLADVFLLNAIYLFVLIKVLHINPFQQHYTIYALFSNVTWLLSFYFCGNYTYKPVKFKKLTRVTLSAFTLFLTVNFIIFHSEFSYVDERFNLENIFLFGSYLIFSRVIIISSLHALHKTGLIRQKIVIIGYDSISGKLIKQLERKNLLYLIDGVFDDKECVNNNNYQLLGKIDDCIEYALKNDIKEIYTVIPAEKDPRMQKIAEVAEMNFIRFKVAKNKSSQKTLVEAFQQNQDLPIESFDAEPIAANVQGQLLKRLFDVLFSLFVIIFILSWLAPIIAILIKLDSPGPVLFKQLRSGIKNKPFWCYKFRSLHVNDDADHKQVTQNDSRYTRLGKFLRKSSIDELPQFFNVLTGDMSIVGSRPHMLKHTEIYSRLHKKYMRRHYIKPGLTGWAQVNGYRGEIKVDEQLIKRVDHDLWYIENWNFWLDIRIVFQTFSSTFKGDKNAY
jgi:putative colanic acid biosynthesis UDP-glucose lipid carrier transferase